MTVHVLPRDRGRVAPDFLPAVPDAILSLLAGELGPLERLAMREIAERADLIFVDGTTYLIAPVSPRCIDALSAFEAGAEDREPEPDEPSIGTYDDLEGGAP